MNSVGKFSSSTSVTKRCRQSYAKRAVSHWPIGYKGRETDTGVCEVSVHYGCAFSLLSARNTCFVVFGNCSTRLYSITKTTIQLRRRRRRRRRNHMFSNTVHDFFSTTYQSNIRFLRSVTMYYYVRIEIFRALYRRRNPESCRKRITIVIIDDDNVRSVTILRLTNARHD